MLSGTSISVGYTVAFFSATCFSFVLVQRPRHKGAAFFFSSAPFIVLLCFLLIRTIPSCLWNQRLFIQTACRFNSSPTSAISHGASSSYRPPISLETVTTLLMTSLRTVTSSLIPPCERSPLCWYPPCGRLFFEDDHFVLFLPAVPLYGGFVHPYGRHA